eukprot:g61136.t1
MQAVGQVMEATWKIRKYLDVIEQETFIRGMVNFMEKKSGISLPNQKTPKETAISIFEESMRQFEHTSWDDKFFIAKKPVNEVKVTSYHILRYLMELKQHNAATFRKVIQIPVSGKVQDIPRSHDSWKDEAWDTANSKVAVHAAVAKSSKLCLPL